MGSIVFTERVRGFSAENAFQHLLEVLSNENEIACSWTKPVENLFLSKRLGSFSKPNEINVKDAEKLINTSFPATNQVNYVDLGRKGYVVLDVTTEKILLRRSKSYNVVEVECKGFNTYLIKRTHIRKLTRDQATIELKRIQKLNLYKEFGIVCEGKEEVIEVSRLLESFHATKPNLKLKETRLILPCHEFLMKGAAYVG